MKPADTVRAWQSANPRADHNVLQGSPEWHQFRASKFGASEAAAMMGISPYTSRGELLRQKFAGSDKEVPADLQRVFNRGHETEALARPIAEAMIEQELYPAVCSRGKLSASCDGITMDDTIAFEHKQFEKDLFAAVSAGVLPDSHVPQCQQVLLVTDAERLLFVCSDGTEDKFASVWVEPDFEYQAKLIAGWNQFEADLASYQSVDIAPAAVAAPIENLPVLAVQITGEVIASNLAEFESVTRSRIAAINTSLTTDQHFADADQMTKFLKDAEDKLKLVKDQALSQTASINELFRAIDRISEEARAKRLELEKLVKARKDSLRGEIVRDGKDAYASHIDNLNARLGRVLLVPTKPPTVMPDFAGAISGKRSFQAMRDAVDATLATAKLDANAIADKVQINLQHFSNIAEQYTPLFRDLDVLLFKDADDFALIVKSRIADHKAAEEKRLADERAKMQAQAEADARAKIAAEQAAQVVAPAPPAVTPTAVSTSPRNVVTMAKRQRPAVAEILACVSSHFGVDEDRALVWMLDTDFQAEARRRSSPQAA